MAINRKKETTKKWRFFKSGLPSIIWDPKNDRPLVNFMAGDPKGTFITDDPKIVKMLRQKGYPEIPLNARTAPDYSVVNPGRSLQDGENVPILNQNINERAGEARIQPLLNQPQAPEVLR